MMSTDPAPAPQASFSAGTFARITGRVQGVNYRNATKRQADELSLVGWVRNTEEAAVEVLVGGDGPAVDSLLSWCRSGPRRAEVESVDKREATVEELESLPADGFVVLR